MHTDKKSLFSHLCSSVFICGSILLCFSFLTSGCDRKTQRQVVLYTSIDQPIAAPIVREFEQKTGIKITLVTDTEATKSVGLAERLRAEKASPQADVWWSNEIFHTINLAAEGLLEPYESQSIDDVSDRYKDADYRWSGVGYRVRMIANHHGAGATTQPVHTLAGLLDPSLKGRIAIANPSAGTTGGHVAALYLLWGDAKADAFFRSLRNNDVKTVGGNSVVAEMVGKGTVLAGLTDNDDIFAAAREGGQIDAILPDQESSGTLILPTTVGLVAGAKHAADAKQLVDFLLSKNVEQTLIDAHFAYGSVREGVGPSVKGMDVEYRAVAGKMPQAVRRAAAILEGRE